MDVRIEVTLAFTVSDSSLADAMAEYGEHTVEALVKEIVDKAIACDSISVAMIERPHVLQDLDSMP
jgi:hypothetical protein